MEPDEKLKWHVGSHAETSEKKCLCEETDLFSL